MRMETSRKGALRQESKKRIARLLAKATGVVSAAVLMVGALTTASAQELAYNGITEYPSFYPSEEMVLPGEYVVDMDSAGAFDHTILGGIQMNGYLNAGGQFNDLGAKYNMTGANSDNQIGFDGAYASLFKKAQTGSGMVDWGFGFDTMFGRDARIFASSKGLDDDWTTGHRSDQVNGWQNFYAYDNKSYGFAMPQLYGELALSNWTTKVGHFYTPLGYETARADGRFFYSLGRSFEVTPITYTGAMMTFKGIPGIEGSVGWACGEDVNFERPNDESLIIGQLKANRDGRTSLKYGFVIGDGSMQGLKGDLFRNDIVLSTKLGSMWETAFIYDYGQFRGNGQGVANTFTGDVTTMMAVCGLQNLQYQTFGGYLYCTLNPMWKVGTRVEWQKGWDRAVGLEDFDVSLGANWNPLGNQHLTVRPEVRYDKATAPIFGNMDKLKKEQMTLGFDVLYRI